MSTPCKSSPVSGSEFRRIAERCGSIRPQMREDFCYNCREKYYIDRDGCAVLMERIVADRPIFNPDHVERLRPDPAPPDRPIMSKADLRSMTAEEWEHHVALVAALDPDPEKLRRELLADMAVEYASNATEYALDHGEDMTLARERENRERAARRARRKVSDYVMAEHDFKYFITLTLNGEDFARSDLTTAVKKLNTWLKNRVQRCGL